MRKKLRNNSEEEGLEEQTEIFIQILKRGLRAGIREKTYSHKQGFMFMLGSVHSLEKYFRGQACPSDKLAKFICKKLAHGYDYSSRVWHSTSGEDAPQLTKSILDKPSFYLEIEGQKHSFLEWVERNPYQSPDKVEYFGELYSLSLQIKSSDVLQNLQNLKPCHHSLV